MKNPRYWDAKAIHLSGITFVNVPTGPQQLTSLESGLVEVEGIPDNDIPALNAQTNLQSSSLFPDASYFFVPICKASGPLANVKVRQALNFATNRTAINNALLFGKGEPAWSIFPSSSSFYDKSLTNVYAFNLKKAKDAAGPGRVPPRLLHQPHGPARSPNDQLATVLQEEWKQIGVSLQIVQSSNYVTDLYTDNKAQMGLNPEGLPGIQKLTTQYIPGDVGDLCNYNNPTLNALTKEVEALPPSSPKLKSVWTPDSGLRHQERPLDLRRLRAGRDRGGQGREEHPEHPLRRRGLELLERVGPGLSAGRRRREMLRPVHRA